MVVLINFKICDNAQGCNGVAVCPSHALSWDQKKKTIVIDNSKCTSCGACESSCMVGAIKVAKNEKEYAILKKEMDADPRKVSDLFVDRYGAQPMHKAFLIKQERFDKEVLSAHKLVNVAELFKSESIVCLYCSIPIKELFPDSNIKYRKVELKDDALTEKYGIKTLPALLFFKDGKMLGKIEGAYQPEKAEELKSLIKPLLGK